MFFSLLLRFLMSTHLKENLIHPDEHNHTEF